MFFQYITRTSLYPGLTSRLQDQSLTPLIVQHFSKTRSVQTGTIYAEIPPHVVKYCWFGMLDCPNKHTVFLCSLLPLDTLTALPPLAPEPSKLTLGVYEYW